MPSQSRSQQRLMGVSYAVKSGDMQLSDVDGDYRDKVKELVDGMSLKQLKDFSETSHEGLPELKEEGPVGNLSHVTPQMLSGMGSVALPTEVAVGSGDVPAGNHSTKVHKKKKKLLLTMNEFIAEYRQQLQAFKPKGPATENIGKGEYEKGSVPTAQGEFDERLKMQRKAKSVVGPGN